LVGLFAEYHRRAGNNFGNARTVGSVFAQIKNLLDVRLHHMDNVDDQDFITILPVDIPDY
jgi:hypothetical protein